MLRGVEGLMLLAENIGATGFTLRLKRVEGLLEDHSAPGIVGLLYYPFRVAHSTLTASWIMLRFP
jgi:hypothetical protein